jgi:anionic cell wall polymer biosynthesis LytR-Cps2A-Psr (LCP) family protein
VSADRQPRRPRVQPMAGVQDGRERQARERRFVLAGAGVGAAILAVLFFVSGIGTWIASLAASLVAGRQTQGVISFGEWVVGCVVYAYAGLLGAVLGGSVGVATIAVSRATQSPAGGRARAARAEFCSIISHDFPSLAAGWSFVLPGVGQALLGKVHRGLMVALPALALGAAIIGLLLYGLLVDRAFLLSLGVNQRWLASLLILDLVALIYHLWAMLDVYRLTRLPRPVVRTAGKWARLTAAGVLVAATLGFHGAVGAAVTDVQHTVDCLTGEIPCWVGDQEQKPGETIAPASDEPDQGEGWIAGGGVVIDPTQPTPTPGNPLASLSPAPYDLGNLAGPFSTDNAAHWRDDGQLVIMIVGVDAGPGGGRNSKNLRYDSANVLQVDLATGKAALYGIPRNLHCVPLPPESAKYYPAWSNGSVSCPAGSFHGMFNALGLEVYNNPTHFPYYQGPKEYYMRQITAYERAASMLTGLHVDGTVLVTLLGFVRLIDDLGGIDINVPKKVVDHPCGPSNTWQGKAKPEGSSTPFGLCPSGGTHNGYGTPEASSSIVPSMKAAGQASGKQSINWNNPGGDVSFVIEAGQQHMNGDWALAYARTRFQDDDYHRIARQQIVLKAVRGAINPCTLAGNPATLLSLISDLGSGMMTNLPIDSATDVADVAGLAQHVLGTSLQTFSLALDPSDPLYWAPYLDNTRVHRLQSIVDHGLDKAPAASPGGGGGSGGGFHC